MVSGDEFYDDDVTSGLLVEDFDDEPRPSTTFGCRREFKDADWCKVHDAYITPGDTTCWRRWQPKVQP